MVKAGDNIVTTGLSGKLRNLIVFRNRVLSKNPYSTIAYTEYIELKK